MKTIFRTSLAAAFILLFYISAFAQVGRIERTTVEHDKSRVDALVVTMSPERKDVQQAFDDWMGDQYDINMKGGGLFSDKNTRNAEAISIPAISNKNISLFTRTEETGGETRMYLFASHGLGNYVRNSEFRAFTGMESVFDSFLSDYLPEYYEERVAEARDLVEDLREDIEKREEDVEKNEKRIADLQQENKELATELKDLDRKLTDAMDKLEKREAVRKRVNRRVDQG